jgi:hypothetical protein
VARFDAPRHPAVKRLANTSAEMARANDSSTAAEPGDGQEWKWKPRSMERQTPQ